MSEILQTNVFFIITSIAVIVVTTLVVIALVYVIRIIKDLSHISETVREESDEIVKDVSAIRSDIKSKANGLKSIIMLVLKRFAPKRTSTHTNNKKNK